jgi:MYXO-CTERM domain-containing protein
MRNRFLALATLLIAPALWSVPAHACSFGTGADNGNQTITGTDVSLSNTNQIGVTGVSVVLCVGTDGTNTFVELDGTPGTSSTGAFNFINQIGFNDTNGNTFDDAFTTGGDSLGWTTGPGNCNGFSGFQVTYTACGNNGKVDTSGEYWELGGTTPTSSDEFAVHIAFANCTGFWGNGSITPDTTSGCSAVSTPEPTTPSLSLLGFGLIGLAAFIRRRLTA